jgi:hypothetical protein
MYGDVVSLHSRPALVWSGPGTLEIKTHPFPTTTMGKIVEVRIVLDDNLPDDRAGVLRCGSVKSYDKNGRLCIDHQDLVDNTEYPSKKAMIFAVAQRLKFHSSIVSIDE